MNTLCLGLQNKDIYVYRGPAAFMLHVENVIQHRILLSRVSSIHVLRIGFLKITEVTVRPNDSNMLRIEPKEQIAEEHERVINLIGSIEQLIGVYC